MSNKHVGSSFDRHFRDQFKDPEFAFEIYGLVSAEVEKLEKDLEESNRQLTIERAENARLHALIKRKGL